MHRMLCFYVGLFLASGLRYGVSAPQRLQAESGGASARGSWPRQPGLLIGGSQRDGAFSEDAYSEKLDRTFGAAAGRDVYTEVRLPANRQSLVRAEYTNGTARKQDDRTLLKLFFQKLGAKADGDGDGELTRNLQTLYAEYSTDENPEQEDANGGDGQGYSPYDYEVAQLPTEVAALQSGEYGAHASGVKPDHRRTCSQCEVMREEARLFRIEAIKQDILSKLQLERLPNVTRRQREPRIPKHLLFGDSYEEDTMQRDSEDTPDFIDDDYATIQRAIKFAEKVPHDKRTQSPDVIYFEMPKQVTGAKIRLAKLGLYAQTIDDGRLTAVVTAYSISSISPHQKEPYSFQKVTIDKKGRWVYLDITSLVESWAVDPESNYGLTATVENLLGGPQAGIRLTGAGDEGERKPFLDIRVGSSTTNRRKRDLGLDCTESSAEERCCRYPFMVDFDEFGPSFDFIITPRRYPANYCAGQCPPTFLPMHTNAQLTQVSRRLPANSRQPCCTPRKMEGVFMVYVDDFGTYMQGVLPGMTIKSCGCS